MNQWILQPHAGSQSANKNLMEYSDISDADWFKIPYFQKDIKTVATEERSV